MQALAKRVAGAGRRRRAGAVGHAAAPQRRSRRPDDAGASRRRPTPAPRPPAVAGSGPPAGAAPPTGRRRATEPAAQGQRAAASRVQEAPVTDDAVARRGCCARIRDVPDYPKPGIVFKDITPLLADHAAFAAGRRGAGRADDRRPRRSDKVVGIEARGFILGAPVALRARRRLRAGAQEGQAARRDARRRRYALEYGEATIEVHRTRSRRVTGCW